MHSYDIINQDDKTLKDYFKRYNLPIPQHWNDNDMTIFD